MEESADETRQIEEAKSPPSVGSPPRARARLEAAREEEEVAEEVGRSAAEKAAPAGEMRTPPVLPPSPPRECPGWELFPVGQDPVLPGAGRAEQQEAERDELGVLVEEPLAAARHATEPAEVSTFLVAVLSDCLSGKSLRGMPGGRFVGEGGFWS